MSEIITTDYRIVQERTLPVIATEILQIEEGVARVALDGAIRIGQRLQEAKEKVEHGQWENWCRDNLNYSKSKTEKLMKIAAEYGDENSPYSKAYTCTDLSISKALRLLQVPEEEVKQFAKDHDINAMTVKELEKEIAELKEKNDASARDKAMLRRELDAASSEAKAKENELKEEIEAKEKEIAGLKEKGEAGEEVEKLRAQLERAKEKADKISQKAKEDIERKERELVERLKEKEEEIRKEEEENNKDKIAQAEKEKQELLTQMESLKRKAQNSQDEHLISFKLSVDALQDNFAKCIEAIEEAGEDKREKMTAALDNVLQALIGELK